MTRPFTDYEDEDLYDAAPAGTQEAVDFIVKVDSEGGISAYLGWGGVGGFPESLQAEANDYYKAEKALRSVIKRWTESNGVRY